RNDAQAELLLESASHNIPVESPACKGPSWELLRDARAIYVTFALHHSPIVNIKMLIVNYLCV
ncbi:MAG: hypothetical protein RLZZ519_2348, partial [Bacteroidota bacterium]